MTSPAASGQHLSKLEKRPKMPHPTALFALNLMQCRRRLQISHVNNIGKVAHPWVPISIELTHMVHLLPFSSYLAASKSVSVRLPVRPGYDDKYCSRSYRFVERQKSGYNTLDKVTFSFQLPLKTERYYLLVYCSCFILWHIYKAKLRKNLFFM